MSDEPLIKSGIILCFDNGLQECQLCGGWLHAGDPPEVPEGELGIAGRYCSHDCHDEAVALGWCDA